MTSDAEIHSRTLTKETMLNMLFFPPNSRNGVIPEDADRLGPLLCLQQGVLHGDGGVEDRRERRTLAVHRGAHYGCVDHWTVGDPGNTCKAST